MDSPKLQRWDNDELRLCLSKGYLSRKHPKLLCAFSGTISLLAQSNCSWLFSAIDFFFVGLGSSHEETSKGWQALKVLVAAQGPVPVLAVGTLEPQ